MSATLRTMSSKTVCAKAVQIRPAKLAARRNVIVRGAAEVDHLKCVVFNPFTAVTDLLTGVDKTDQAITSFARAGFHAECEAAVNEQINIEYNVSYVYHAMFAYFDRDNVARQGFAQHFKAASEEEWGHAELLMKFQNMRGGRVVLKSIMMPEMEFDHMEKGDALYAAELALSLEKLNFQKLRELREVADKYGDANMADFVDSRLLEAQVPV
jgi:ferritin heavy chain